MIHFSYAGQADTLCGAEYKEPSKKAAKDGRVCDDCIKVMWLEQHRRNTLMPYIKKARKQSPKSKQVTDDSPPRTSDDSPVYLRGYIAL